MLLSLVVFRNTKKLTKLLFLFFCSINHVLFVMLFAGFDVSSFSWNWFSFSSAKSGFPTIRTGWWIFFLPLVSIPFISKSLHWCPNIRYVKLFKQHEGVLFYQFTNMDFLVTSFTIKLFKLLEGPFLLPSVGSRYIYSYFVILMKKMVFYLTCAKSLDYAAYYPFTYKIKIFYFAMFGENFLSPTLCN